MTLPLIAIACVSFDRPAHALVTRHVRAALFRGWLA